MLYWINLMFVRKLDDSPFRTSMYIGCIGISMHPKMDEIEWFAVRSMNLIKFTLLICILKKFFKFSLSCYPFPRKLNWAFSSSAYYEPLTDCSIYWIWYRKRRKLNEMAISIKTWLIKDFFFKFGPIFNILNWKYAWRHFRQFSQYWAIS